MTEEATVEIRAYLRSAVEAGQPAEARFSFEGVDCALLATETGQLELHKVKADASLAKAVLGKGQWSYTAQADDSNLPPLTGMFSTSKGTLFEIAGWVKGPEQDRYYSLNIKPRVVRKGFLPGIKP